MPLARVGSEESAVKRKVACALLGDARMVLIVQGFHLEGCHK